MEQKNTLQILSIKHMIYMYVCMYLFMQVLNAYKMHKFTSNLICSRLQKLNDLRMISLTSQIECSLIFLTQTHIVCIYTVLVEKTLSHGISVHECNKFTHSFR